MKTVASSSKNSLNILLVMVLVAVGWGGCKSKSEVSEQSYRPEKVREEIRLLADSLKNDNYIGTEQMGRLPIPAPAYLRRQALMRNAYDAELKNLSYHPNTVVSLVAFEGLYERENDAVPEIFDRLSERTDALHYIRGDISTPIPMLEYAYVYVMRFQMPGEEIPAQLDAGVPRFQLSEQAHGRVVQKILDLRRQQ